jgi:cellulose synthase/poly-beta-1,6-N-acetylglucosamine synthase-like glycosyltransferase
MQTITIVYTVMFFFGIYFMLMFILLYGKNKQKLYDFPIPQKFLSVSFIVPVYNEAKSLANTVQALLDVDYPDDKKEILIVNDGSIDGTEEIARVLVKKYSQVKLVNKKNSGKADSINKALGYAKGQLIAVVDADSHPMPDALKKMVGYFEYDEKVAAVTSKVYVRNKKNFIERFQDFDYAVIAWGRKILDFINCVYVTNGPLSVYRKKALLDIGGFDPKNITEDIEVTWNLLSHGYKTEMSYSAKVYTIVPSNLKKWISQRVRWNVGGLQTLHKYRKFFLRSENLFGYFVMTYVGLSFVLSLLGFFLLARFFYLKFVNNLSLLPFIFSGYNPFNFIEFNVPLTLLLIFGLIFLFLSFVYHKLAIRGSEVKSKSLLNILIYTFIYRPLYLVPLLISFYKIAKGDIGWYTK